MYITYTTICGQLSSTIDPHFHHNKHVYCLVAFCTINSPSWNIQLWDERARSWRRCSYRGVSQLVQPSDIFILITRSIVAIHGLDGHRERSFTASNGVLWLRDLLPKSIPNARILTYGYDARTHGKNRSQQMLYDLSTNFMAKLSNFRVYTKTNRPLIFVAHSFGGIMLKNALIQAHLDGDEHLSHHKAIASFTYGIIYLGTPHQGIDLTSWSRSFAKSHSISHQNDPILIQLGLHSETLEQQLTQYTAISGKYHTLFCYEIYLTGSKGKSSKASTFTAHACIVLTISLQHVPVFSARVPGSVNTEAIGFSKDHMGLVRFSSMDDDDYVQLSQRLLQMVEVISSQHHKLLEKLDTIGLGNPDDVHELQMSLYKQGM
ncbi:hypothetical protein BU17DRAFT_55925 [Hysterangium stoloniferum]|nr:hypothetical protein BU17DRAFT_55925 [Hysterangium stoloniferum]